MINQHDEVLPQVGTERIVLAMDGGAGSRAALRWVADHLHRPSFQVSLVHVTEKGAPDEGGMGLDAAALVLQTLSDSVETLQQVRHGDPADELAAAAAELDADLLVIGTHASAEHQQWVQATVPGRLAARSGCVVIVVPEDWTPTSGPIVVGSSIDSASDSAVDFAHDTAAREHRDLVVAHVWELPTVGEVDPTPGGGESIPERQQQALDRVVRDIASRIPRVAVKGDLRRGPAARGLTAAAEGAALLVVGRRRRPAAARVLLGSTSRSLVSGPPCAVAVVPGPLPGLHITPETLPEDP